MVRHSVFVLCMPDEAALAMRQLDREYCRAFHSWKPRAKAVNETHSEAKLAARRRHWRRPARRCDCGALLIPEGRFTGSFEGGFIRLRGLLGGHLARHGLLCSALLLALLQARPRVPLLRLRGTGVSTGSQRCVARIMSWRLRKH